MDKADCRTPGDVALPESPAWVFLTPYYYFQNNTIYYDPICFVPF